MAVDMVILKGSFYPFSICDLGRARPCESGSQASFHTGLRGFERDKSCSVKHLAILLRNRPESNVYGIEPRITTDLVNPFSNPWHPRSRLLQPNQVRSVNLSTLL